MTETSVFGVPVLVGEKDELFFAAKFALGRGGRIATVNPEMLDAARRDPTFAALLSSFLAIPDGQGLARELRRRGFSASAYPGVDLAEALLSFTKTLALVGARPGVAEAAAKKLTARHPGLRVPLVADGYTFSVGDLSARLAALSPDLCFVCLGSPRQERVIAALSEHSPRTLFLGLGGALDVYAGKVKRAPAFFRRLGLEWLFRMLREPRRFSRFPALLRFVFFARTEKSPKMRK